MSVELAAWGRHMMITDVAEEVDCRCASLPAGWPVCGQRTSSSWAPGCDARAVDEAIARLGFGSRDDFVSWVAAFGRVGERQHR
jgi:hypothetical protein